ncbi:MAG TPA: DUF4434 domain-containing protein [Thermoanaerobaculia bacterium]|nr:DUF4434 domain-containing protein [Thermoanaerobaculia bacterium]
MLLLCAPAEAQKRGAFIAFDGETKNWAAVFERMKDAGMNTAILQYTCTTSGYFYNDETDAFINAAEIAKMDYYLGLRYHETWDTNGAAVPMYVNDSIELLTKVLPPKVRNVKHFKGWYMALEVGNDTNAVEHTAKLKEIAEKSIPPIAMSVYFNPDRAAGKLSPTAFAEKIRTTIKKYDIVLFQDSVGKHGTWAVRRLPDYYSAVADHAQQTWIIAEAFRGDCSATEAEYKKQLEAARKLNADGNIFAFEFLKNFDPASGPLVAWKETFSKP